MVVITVGLKSLFEGSDGLFSFFFNSLGVFGFVFPFFVLYIRSNMYMMSSNGVENFHSFILLILSREISMT